MCQVARVLFSENWQPLVQQGFVVAQSQSSGKLIGLGGKYELVNRKATLVRRERAQREDQSPLADGVEHVRRL
jgi:hypothetical protein